MQEIQIPFPLKGIPLKPELTGKVKIDETMIQSLAALCGWDGEARRLLTCALNGALHVVSPPISAITNQTLVSTINNTTFGDIPTTEIIVMANPANGGDIWLNLNADAAVDTGYYLDAGDWVKLSINNLQSLHLLPTQGNDKVIILRTV